MFLLDTNVVSELRLARTGRANPHVVRWAAQVPAGAMHLSVISLLELEIGVRRIERRDPTQGQHLRAWLDVAVAKAFLGRLLAVDASVARRCASLHVPDPRPERDALIAATAWVHGLTVVTRNGGDFAGTGVAVLDPWAASQASTPSEPSSS